MEPNTKRLKSDNNEESDEEWARFEAEMAGSPEPSEPTEVSALDAAVIQAEPVKINEESKNDQIPEKGGSEEEVKLNDDDAERDASELAWEEEEKQEELNARVKKMKELYRSVKSTRVEHNKKVKIAENEDQKEEEDDEEYDEEDVWK
ncbi:hypothetical protein TRVA0_027S01090 [Trichomonascus vanleenenianus]|uniref:uncharacterized protein n=1 Tax=Trichomonascus vanleenenianus TaxID=2268995 RepID=UPI003ECA1594